MRRPFSILGLYWLGAFAGRETMERSNGLGLFLCFVIAFGVLLYLGYYAYKIGGLQVEEGSSISDDFARAERWSEVRR